MEVANHEGRMCYYIPAEGFIEGHGYRVAIVFENESGHYPTGNAPEGGLQQPWYWGQTYAEAKEIAAKQNLERLGHSEMDVLDIISSSMAAGNRRK